ncbi:MAG: hypothetical protein IJ620_02275 [Bacteroidales bacterium]|nr:hypothetical protein [Bacteroidales bacterium]
MLPLAAFRAPPLLLDNSFLLAGSATGHALPAAFRPTALDHLYGIDTAEGWHACLNAFQSAFNQSFNTLARKKDLDDVQRIATGYHDNGKPIDADLYRLYSETLRKAVSLGGIDPDLRDQWLANVSRFAAYKAARATQQVAETVIEHGGDLGSGIAPLRAHKRYLAAEANTARTRARTGKQWQQFNDDDHLRLFPNLRWVPSRSATPREAHQIFWNKVWAKDDPFWLHNQPGTLWNCKCDWEETDDPVTAGNPQKNIEVPGLKGNPATTGKIFSDDATYFTRCQNKETVEPIAQSIVEFERLQHTGDYKDMVFDWHNGAYKGVHKKHIDHSNPKEERYFDDKVTVTQLEKECMDEVYRMGHRAILLEEGIKGADKKPICCLDLRLDGRIMDIRTITIGQANNIRNGIWKKNSQLAIYNSLNDTKADSICLYFRYPDMFKDELVREAIANFKQQSKPDGTSITIHVKHVICVVKGYNQVIEYDI